MKRLFFGILAGVLSWVGPIPARGATIFSFHGPGDMVRRIDARSRAMGGAGRAVVDGRNFSTHNPALLGAFTRTSLSAQFLAQRRVPSGGGAINDGDLGAVQVVSPTRIGVIGLGIDPMSEMSFGAVDDIGSGDLAYELYLNATGGVQALSLGMGRRLGPRVLVGARLDWIALGTINERWVKTFQKPDLFFSQDDFTHTHRGWMPSFGAVFTPGERWSFGGNIRFGREIRQRTIHTSRFVAQQAAVKLESERQIKFPHIAGLGVAYLGGYRWMAAADVERGFWSSTGSGRFDTWDLSAGFLVRRGSPDLLYTGRRLEFMGGVHYRSLYFPTASGRQIGETAASLGMGIPLKHDVGVFRYTLEFGKRGNQAQHGVSERFFLHSFSVTGYFF